MTSDFYLFHVFRSRLQPAICSHWHGIWCLPGSARVPGSNQLSIVERIVHNWAKVSIMLALRSETMPQSYLVFCWGAWRLVWGSCFFHAESQPENVLLSSLVKSCYSHVRCIIDVRWCLLGGIRSCVFSLVTCDACRSFSASFTWQTEAWKCDSENRGNWVETGWQLDRRNWRNWILMTLRPLPQLSRQ